MKRILIAVFAAFVLTAWVVPAMAVDTTFYGTYRVRMFSTNNAADYADGDKQKTYTGAGSTTADGAVNTDNNSWIDQRFRLGIESKASDQLRGFVQLEIGDLTEGNRSNIWGTSNTSTTSLTVNARQAYLSFNAGPVRVKAGRQVFGDTTDGGQSFRVSDDNVYYGLADGGLVLVSRVDAFILTSKVEPVTLYFGYAKLAEGSSSSTTTDAQDRDNTLYILQAKMAPSDTLKAGAYFLYDKKRDAMTTAIGEDKPWWLGVGVDAKLDPIDLKVHAVYKGGTQDKGCQSGSCGLTSGSDDLKYAAYALDVDVSANVGPAKVGFAAGRGTGDKSTEDKKSQTFSGVAPSYGNQLGARPAIFFDAGEVSNGGATLNTTNSNGISNTTLGNVTFAEIYGSFKATDELSLNALAAIFRHTEKKRTTGTNTSTTWDSELGTEVDLVAVYKLYKELALVAQAAWFLPGDGIKSSQNQAGNWSGIASDDKVSEYFARIQYDF